MGKKNSAISIISVFEMSQIYSGKLFPPYNNKNLAFSPPQPPGQHRHDLCPLGPLRGQEVLLRGRPERDARRRRHGGRHRRHGAAAVRGPAGWLDRRGRLNAWLQVRLGQGRGESPFRKSTHSQIWVRGQEIQLVRPVSHPVKHLRAQIRYINCLLACRKN